MLNCELPASPVQVLCHSPLLRGDTDYWKWDKARQSPRGELCCRSRPPQQLWRGAALAAPLPTQVWPCQPSAKLSEWYCDPSAWELQCCSGLALHPLQRAHRAKPQQFCKQCAHSLSFRPTARCHDSRAVRPHLSRQPALFFLATANGTHRV